MLVPVPSMVLVYVEVKSQNALKPPSLPSITSWVTSTTTLSKITILLSSLYMQTITEYKMLQLTHITINYCLLLFIIVYYYWDKGLRTCL